MTGAADILRRLEPAGPPDRELLARFVAHRDQSAFAELVRRHGPVVLGVCRRVTGHPQDAEDAFQAVFLVLARKAGRIGNPDLLGNWLYGVAVRVAQKARRSAARRRAREVAVSPLPDPPARPAPISGELGPILDEELAALPSWYRDAILLCDLRGLSREEAAVLLGVPEGTLSSRLANGRKKLAARLTKRGVALSVAAIPAAVAEAQAGVAVSVELLTKTCGLVADWSAGTPVPGPLARLAEGGFTVRKTLLLGVMATAVAVASAVYAARPDDEQPAKAVAPRPAGVAKGEEIAQPKAAEQVEEKPALAKRPRLRSTCDLHLDGPLAMAWSLDGSVLAVQGRFREETNIFDLVTVATRRPWDSEKLETSGNYNLDPAGRLVGFTPDGKWLAMEKREYQLVSGEHRLSYTPVAMSTERNAQKAVIDRNREVWRVSLESDDTQGYRFAADGRTYRTVSLGAPVNGLYGFSVQQVQATTGVTQKTLMTTDTAYTWHALSHDGTRLAVIDPSFNVTVFDVDTGKKLWTKPVKLQRLRPFTPGLAFSRNGKRLVVTGDVNPPVVLNADTGEPLPELEGGIHLVTSPTDGSFSSDGRLLALSGGRFERVEAARKGFGGREGGQASWETRGECLCVWNTESGKLLKNWTRPATVAFHPSKPILAILEPNGTNTSRLGLWDFSAEVEKK